MTEPPASSEPTSVETAAERDRVGGARDQAAGLRDRAADLRDEAGARRDRVGGDRDEAARARDQAGDVRDGAADERDVVADLRDSAAERRDRQASARDRAALQGDAEQRGRTTTPAASGQDAVRYAVARRDAAGDREHAARDRRAGASERARAGSDRESASADRLSGALERHQADSDRGSAQGDRGSGADGRVSSAGDRTSASVDRGQARVDLQHASLDGLTGVYTRSAGLLELQREIDRARRSGVPLVVAFVDVDGLKAVNDTRGHLAGDGVLVRVAEALKGRLRPYDLVIRYGGDEFLCVLAETRPDEAAARLGGTNLALAQGDPPVSVSVGTSDLQPADTLGQLVERADRDLYLQRAGRGPRPPR